jgi:F-type H+-transporting ATPase subunit delta
MKNLTVARRYARALFELAQETKSLDDVLRAMSNIRHALSAAADLRPLLVSPMVRPEDKRKLVGAVTSNKLVLRFIDLLARRKRLDLIETVHDLLIEMGDAVKGIHHALVKSAQPLTDQQKRDVESGLAKSAGGSVVGRFEVDASLLGGVWVQMGDKVLDASLRGRLDSMRHALVNSAN